MSDPRLAIGDLESAIGSSDRDGGESTRQLPPIVEAREFFQSRIAPPPELVCGILHQTSKMAVAGGSKTFKTWILLDLALSVAFGEPWLGFKTTKGRVLFLNFEIPPAFFQQRIREISEAKGCTLEVGQLDLWNLRGHAASYAILLPQILARVRECAYMLIILDPIYKLYGETDENSAGDVALLLNALEELSVRTSAAVAFGAHYSKGNQAARESIDRISGSGVFARDPDTILNLTQHQEKDAFTVEATLRNFKSIEPFVVRWQFPLMRRSPDLDPRKLKKPGAPRKFDVTMLLAALSQKSITTEDWWKRVSARTGMSRRTFYSLKIEAVGIPGVKQIRPGQWVYRPSTNVKRKCKNEFLH